MNVHVRMWAQPLAQTTLSCYYKEVSLDDLPESSILIDTVETLSLRVERHCQNALALALWLQEQPQVS
jgi:O-acetylhomoserine/O-acetylserine sulfhydrylase-like pyridoxal-dependent enzyme